MRQVYQVCQEHQERKAPKDLWVSHRIDNVVNCDRISAGLQIIVSKTVVEHHQDRSSSLNYIITFILCFQDILDKKVQKDREVSYSFKARVSVKYFWTAVGSAGSQVFYFLASGDQGSIGPPGLRGPAGPPGDTGLPGDIPLIHLELYQHYFNPNEG